MEKGVFTVDDIHRLRLENAQRRAKMTEDEAEKDFKEQAEYSRCAIEEMRRSNQQNTKH